jgi:hypothetical protein
MSGSKVPYHLRVNKYVDRQLLLEILDYVARYQTMSDVGYISMGGGYLEDFRVLHQAFGIRRMLSFDLEEWMIKRQQVNRPYGFIKCQCASSTTIVQDFDAVRDELVGEDGRVIVWLDYTEADMRYHQLSDLEELTKRLIHGDVFRITMNAHRPNFGTLAQYELAKKAEETDSPSLAAWWNEKLIEQLQDYMASDRKDVEYIESEHEFAVTLTRAIKIAAQNGLRSRPTLMIEPLLSVVYADKQQMITVTGIVLDREKRQEFLDQSRWQEWKYKPGDDWDNLVCLAVPHLSVMERHLIHGMIMQTGSINNVSQLDFRLDADDDAHSALIQQYVTHYRRYPTFAPVDNM